MKKIAILMTLVVLLAVPCQAEKGILRTDDDEKRLALVIGNADYRTAPLKNPVNDARDMSEMLESLGFEVIYRENASRKEMEDAVFTFGKTLRRGGVGLFYFSGHGLQVKGRNYLIPVDARIESESDVTFECVDAGRVLGKMEDAGNRLNVVILDACRNNPFARSFRSANQGLARMDAPQGSLIAYATAPDSVAADGDGRNGTYTKYLLKHMEQPSLIIEKVFKNVRNDVVKETGGIQTPWESTSLMGDDFYFAGGGEYPPTPTPTPAPPSASLSVKCAVNGATVSLDGNVIGKTPISDMDVKPGEYRMTVEKPGYVSYGENVAIEPGRNVFHAFLGKSPAPTPAPTPVKPVVSTPAAPLRDTPKTLSDDEVRDLIKTHNFYSTDEYNLTKKWANPSGDFENDFVDNGDGTVTDRATGLMWQKGGSSKYMKYKDAEAYINSINSEKFAGHSDWRLPTLPELASLLESKQLNDGLYIDPVFDKNQGWCWSSDQRSSGSAWLVRFGHGYVYRLYHDYGNFVRAVRRGQ